MPVIYGQTVQPSSTVSLGDGTSNPVLAGKAAELVTCDLHGSFYTSAYRGLSYMANTLPSGVTIPLAANNFAATFLIWNPAGSSVNVELMSLSLGILSTTLVVSDVSLYLQSGVGTSIAAPSSLTALATRPTLWGGGSVAPIAGSKATVYSAATITGTLGSNLWRGPVITSFAATSSNNVQPIRYQFNGEVLLGPGTLAALAGQAAQSQAMAHSITWAEWPI